MAHPWFEQLFGFAEGPYPETQAQFEVEGTTLRSRVNGRSFAIGSFSTPSLAELRARSADAPAGELRLTHEVIGDVLELHAAPENRGALFQVASQFNCLEFADPEVVPEDGVSDYAHDPTQGPACSLAAAAATVYRNYFAPVAGVPGQTRERQLDNLDELAAALGQPGAYFEVRNGYTSSDAARLAALAKRLDALDRERLLGAVKIGLQTDVGVTFARRFVEPAEPTSVSQSFCSAISCGYSREPLELWAPLACLVLDATYEATLRAAALHSPSRRVWLTFVGGGAFGNRKEWIGAAIGRALARLADVELDVRVAHYRRRDEELVELIERAR